MATYRVGSSGSGVRELQELLNQNGANIAVDGKYGGETEGAVRQYQQNNGLTVDGIAGDETFGSLRSGSSSTTNKTPQTSKEWLQYYETNKPADYNSSYQGQIDELLSQITGRKPFQYDYASDPLYQQYAQNYQRMGKLAMQDTMGQAAALTGGYGNTYATTAGQQMYNQYMQQLNNIIPELQQNAYGMYADEGDRMAQMLAIYQAADKQAYDRWADQYSMWQGERDYWYDKHADELALAARGTSGGSSRSSSDGGGLSASALNALADSIEDGVRSKSTYDAMRSYYTNQINSNSNLSQAQKNQLMAYFQSNVSKWYLENKKPKK